MAASLTKVFGIDLGTTYSCISYVDEHGKPVVVPNAENERITPSVVFFDGANVVVGDEAKGNSKLQPNAVVSFIKREMGKSNYVFELDGKSYRPEEISSFVLRKVVGDAEKSLGEKVTDVIITCPAYFGIPERDATAKAGEIAGLNVRSIINEPTAAAIAYGMEKAKDQVVLVYDLGGGTFDITMIEVTNGAITVLCTGGDHFLGGKNWDDEIVKYLGNEFKEKTGLGGDILDDPITLQDLYLNAERAKKTLSLREKAPLAITHAGKRITVDLTREKFDELSAALLERTVALTKEMLDEAKKKGHTRFDKFLLVGGSTRMPQVPKRLKEEFKAECEMYDPDESVAKGAAIYGWKLALDEEIKIVIATSTGQEAENVDIDKTRAADVKKAQQEVINRFGLPASTVERANKLKVVNVTSKTFGIVALDEQRQKKVSNLILRNDKVPADISQMFGTVDDNQRSLEIILMEGLQLAPKVEISECTEIAKDELELPSGLPAHSPIDVNFKLNEQGRLEVTVTEPRSKNTRRIDITISGVMSQDEVEKAKSRALAMAVS